jgi:hypothetical protein
MQVRVTTCTSFRVTCKKRKYEGANASYYMYRFPRYVQKAQVKVNTCTSFRVTCNKRKYACIHVPVSALRTKSVSESEYMYQFPQYMLKLQVRINTCTGFRATCKNHRLFVHLAACTEALKKDTTFHHIIIIGCAEGILQRNILAGPRFSPRGPRRQLQKQS